MTITATPRGFLVSLPYGRQLCQWGPYPTEQDAVAVEARLLHQLALEAGGTVPPRPLPGQLPLPEAD